MLEKLTENQWKILKNFAAFSGESAGRKRLEFFCKIRKERLKPEKKSCKLYTICNKMKNL